MDPNLDHNTACYQCCGSGSESGSTCFWASRIRTTSQRYGSGSGSGSFYDHAKIGSKKNLDSYYFVTLFDFLSLKNDVNVASKSNTQKKLS